MTLVVRTVMWCWRCQWDGGDHGMGMALGLELEMWEAEAPMAVTGTGMEVEGR